MKQQSDDFKTVYARLKARRDKLRGKATQRKKNATPFRRAFSAKSKPKSDKE